MPTSTRSLDRPASFGNCTALASEYPEALCTDSASSHRRDARTSSPSGRSGGRPAAVRGGVPEPPASAGSRAVHLGTPAASTTSRTRSCGPRRHACTPASTAGSRAVRRGTPAASGTSTRRLPMWRAVAGPPAPPASTTSTTSFPAAVPSTATPSVPSPMVAPSVPSVLQGLGVIQEADLHLAAASSISPSSSSTRPRAGPRAQL